MILSTSIYKFFRFCSIYGLRRTIIKTLGRLNFNFPIYIFIKNYFLFKNKINVGFIGTGHHSFSSIAFFLCRNTNSKFIWAYDINLKNLKKFKISYGIKDKLNDYKNITPDIVYIVSNHSTHTEYAIDFLNKGVDVYVEKPISTNYEQLKSLDMVLKNTNNKLFAGYNRPFSKAIKYFKNKMVFYNQEPLTASFFVIGHKIPENHWYRKKNEGTRIIGNLGHWIDLSVHILYQKSKMFSCIDVDISYSNLETPSENISVVLTTNFNDIISIVFSAREDPFEGVSETINFQIGELISKINDFRSMEIWEKSSYKKIKYRIKDNGHKEASLQPFNEHHRQWDELKCSTSLMLFIETMVLNRQKNKTFTKK